jgi:hypothetical protein
MRVQYYNGDEILLRRLISNERKNVQFLYPNL